ncbi:MAG: FIST C-terminal domain-containing protein [Magnetococcales bacterium]|nr:FIST C-terminal domain-containing protein [Magnetococcales bacterium]
MEVAQVQFRQGVVDPVLLEPLQRLNPMLVLVFADRCHLQGATVEAMCRTAFPDAHCVGVSTAGEISAQGVHDASCLVTALRFDRGGVRVVTTAVTTPADSRSAGMTIGAGLRSANLRGVLLFAPGRQVDGSDLLAGMRTVMGEETVIVGGLSWSEESVGHALIRTNAGVDGQQVVAVGLYGEAVTVHACSRGGWGPFGPLRKVTRCTGNLLLELDGEPALTLYNRYLGEYAKDLPESGLRFPFEMRVANATADGLIRTVLAVDPHRGGLLLGGEIDPAGEMRLMHVTPAKLVSGAEQAAEWIVTHASVTPPGLGLLISCVGRKLIMGDQIAEETEAVRHWLGHHHQVAGFYAHGEIGPLAESRRCELHNLTMTVALIVEDV